MSSRAEHMAWCKARALEYVDAGDLDQAFASFASDITKHPETKGLTSFIGSVGLPMLIGGMLSTPAAMRKFIEDFG